MKLIPKLLLGKKEKSSHFSHGGCPQIFRKNPKGVEISMSNFFVLNFFFRFFFDGLFISFGVFFNQTPLQTLTRAIML